MKEMMTEITETDVYSIVKLKGLNSTALTAATIPWKKDETSSLSLLANLHKLF